MLCKNCEKRDACKKPCYELNKQLRKISGQYWEIPLREDVKIIPQKRQVQFSDMPESTNVENFSAKMPWLTGEFKLRQTNVFRDRFFKKMSFKEIADNYGIDEHTAETHFHNACNQVEAVVRAMDSRKAGVKHSLNSKRGYTDSQKFFLLVKVFGFSGSEVARMFKISRKIVNRHVRDMAARFTFTDGP
jgi:DNA-binding CsgD family transcriptional regulator